MPTNRDPSSKQGQITNSGGQSFVLSESHTEARHEAEAGRAFIIGSGFIVHSDTADTFKAMLYIENTSDEKEIHLGYLRTCNEVPGKWQLHKGVTAISSGSPVAPLNMNGGKKKSLTATVTAGGSASDFTGGTIYPQWIQGGPAHSIQPFDGSYIMGPGDTLGLSFAPFAAATSNEACITMQLWQVDPD